MDRGKTISFTKGKGQISHNNREFLAKNVDPERVKNNIVVKQEKLTDVYKKLFGPAIEEYNTRQKRKDRKKTVKKYMSEIKKQETSRGGTKLFFENIVQIGTVGDTGNLTNQEEAEKAAQILLEYCQNFERRNPNLYLFDAVIHRDEATPHLHLDFVPVAKEGAKRGLSVRNSFSQALREQGVVPGEKENEFTAWRKKEIEELRQLAENKNIQIKEPSTKKRQYLTPDEYRELGRQATEQARIEVRKELNKQLEKIAELTKSNENLEKKLEELQQSEVVHPETPALTSGKDNQAVAQEPVIRPAESRTELAALKKRLEIIKDNLKKGEDIQLKLEFQLEQARIDFENASIFSKWKIKEKIEKLKAAYTSNAQKIEQQQKLRGETVKKIEKILEVPVKAGEKTETKANTKARSAKLMPIKTAIVRDKQKERGSR